MDKLLEALQQIELIAVAECHVCNGNCNHDVFFQDIAAIAKAAQQSDDCPSCFVPLHTFTDGSRACMNETCEKYGKDSHAKN